MLCHKCYEQIHLGKTHCPKCGITYKNHPSIREYYDVIEHFEVIGGVIQSSDVLMPIKPIHTNIRRARMVSIIEHLYRKYMENEAIIKRYKIRTGERYCELTRENMKLRSRIMNHYRMMSGIHAKQHTDQSLLIKDRFKWRG